MFSPQAQSQVLREQAGLCSGDEPGHVQNENGTARDFGKRPCHSFWRIVWFQSFHLIICTFRCARSFRCSLHLIVLLGFLFRPREVLEKYMHAEAQKGQSDTEIVVAYTSLCQTSGCQ